MRNNQKNGLKDQRSIQEELIHDVINVRNLQHKYIIIINIIQQLLGTKVANIHKYGVDL